MKEGSKTLHWQRLSIRKILRGHSVLLEGHMGAEDRKAFTFMGWSRDRYGGKLFQKVSSRVRKQGAINQGIFPGERI